MDNFKIVVALALLVSFCSCKTQKKEKESKTRPNIVIIYADDMGYGDLNCQNPDSKIPTPHLDQLARQGMRFTDAHSASGVCSPSRYSLLTGRYHWRGHLKKGIIGTWGDPAIEDGRTTLASMLKGNGYNTACVGKWHLGMIWPFKPGIGQNEPDKPTWRAADKKNIPMLILTGKSLLKKAPSPMDLTIILATAPSIFLLMPGLKTTNL